MTRTHAAMGGIAGHAGLFSTAGDIADFAQMILNGGIYAHHRVFFARDDQPNSPLAKPSATPPAHSAGMSRCSRRRQAIISHPAASATWLHRNFTLDRPRPRAFRHPAHKSRESHTRQRTRSARCVPPSTTRFSRLSASPTAPAACSITSSSHRLNGFARSAQSERLLPL